MVRGGEEEAEASESGELRESDEEMDLDPLCCILLEIDWPNSSSDWMMRKVDEIKDCVGISCVGFEEQFRALLIAIEVGQPSLARSALKKERELMRLSCSINYNAKGESAFKDKGKERVVYSHQ